VFYVASVSIGVRRKRHSHPQKQPRATETSTRKQQTHNKRTTTRTHRGDNGCDVAVPPAPPFLKVRRRGRVHPFVQPAIMRPPMFQQQQGTPRLEQCGGGAQRGYGVFDGAQAKRADDGVERARREFGQWLLLLLLLWLDMLLLLLLLLLLLGWWGMRAAASAAAGCAASADAAQ
jgi:hypothetical protein